MEDFGSISTMQAFLDLGITRLASRIHDLRRMGIDIDKTIVSRHNRYGEKTHFAVYRRAA
jgi:hypothetical protein